MSLQLFKHYVFPLIIMSIVPVLSVGLVSYTSKTSFSDLPRLFSDCSQWSWIYAWLIFVGWAAVSQFIPFGKYYYGPETSTGHKPVYRDNGFTYYILTMAILIGIDLQGHWDVSTLANHFVVYTIFSNIFGIFVAVLLYVKGCYFPTTGQTLRTGSFLFDLYSGIELYPRIKSFDIKMFTNCRYGMMLWNIIIYAFFRNHHSLNSLTCFTLQTIYIAKFFWWEAGYMKSIDIIVDHAGYMICYGCIAVVPTFYTLASYYWMHNTATGISAYEVPIISLVFGIAMVILNYWVDYQRQLARRTDGQCTLFGKEAKMLTVEYATEYGLKQSKLLYSGFWGWARHFNYVPEILACLFWCTTGTFNEITLFYPIYLTILLVHRSIRDDDKCLTKYGDGWVKYCELVKYKIIPGIY